MYLISLCFVWLAWARYPAVPDYVDVAFQTAREVGGNDTKLFYNDYNVASASGWSKSKSDRMCVRRTVLLYGFFYSLHTAILFFS